MVAQLDEDYQEGNNYYVINSKRTFRCRLSYIVWALVSFQQLANCFRLLSNGRPPNRRHQTLAIAVSLVIIVPIETHHASRKDLHIMADLIPLSTPSIVVFSYRLLTDLAYMAQPTAQKSLPSILWSQS